MNHQRFLKMIRSIGTEILLLFAHDATFFFLDSNLNINSIDSRNKLIFTFLKQNTITRSERGKYNSK